MQKHADVVDQFKVNKNQVKMIFVDEILIQIDGQNYWLWIAYEPNIHSSLLFHISRERMIFLLSVFQADQNEIWKKETNLYRWRLLLV